MGYYTHYELEITGVGGEKCIDSLKVNSGYNWDGSDLYDAKWYRYKDDALAASKLYPNTTIVITGHGEESGDEWRHWFMSGMDHRSNAKITYDAPDWA